MTYKVHRRVVGQDRVVLSISGRISGDGVNTLRSLLSQEKASSLTLDLKDVRLVDDEAVKLLAAYEANGTVIINCPMYIREWVRRERGTG
jgi:anti-anti-sigma regulatory factor